MGRVCAQVCSAVEYNAVQWSGVRWSTVGCGAVECGRMGWGALCCMCCMRGSSAVGSCAHVYIRDSSIRRCVRIYYRTYTHVRTCINRHPRTCMCAHVCFHRCLLKTLKITFGALTLTVPLPSDRSGSACPTPRPAVGDGVRVHALACRYWRRVGMAGRWSTGSGCIGVGVYRGRGV